MLIDGKPARKRAQYLRASTTSVCLPLYSQLPSCPWSKQACRVVNRPWRKAIDNRDLSIGSGNPAVLKELPSAVFSNNTQPAV